MATLIPALGACVSRMTTGERRLAERLEQKFDDDCLLWYDVPIAPLQSHPDFLLMHLRRGLLVLEVKDWNIATIERAGKQTWDILPGSVPKTVANPLEQARQYAHKVVDTLKRDPQLVQPDGPHQGQLVFPWGYGVVLANITRTQFDAAKLGEVIEPNHVLCQNEMRESADPEEIQQRFWQMLTRAFCIGPMTQLQLDRVRWILFPNIRMPTHGALCNDADPYGKLPAIMRVMDQQQVQVAQSLGDGHRVIHGAAGSGKTMILVHRAEYLARSQANTSKPILILCYNAPLAVELRTIMLVKGLDKRVHVQDFQKWCHDQLVAFGQELPSDNLQVVALMEDTVQRVIDAVEHRLIPSGQYQSILIDEGHDFAPEWLKLVTLMVDPSTQSLLLLIGDVQNMNSRLVRQQFNLKSIGLQVQGRTSILKISERHSLLASIASTIRTYRQGELPEPTPEHVDRWASQFSAADQVLFLSEFDHVIKQTFLTKTMVQTFLDGLVKNSELVGTNPITFWKKANFLRIQKAGRSQNEMLDLFGYSLTAQCGLDLAQCGSEGGDYIYLDDVLFSGGRIASDLDAWIATKAPKNAVVHVILMAIHTSGHYYIANNRLRKAVAASGKNIDIKFWRLLDFENQKDKRNNSSVLWPATIPDYEIVHAYVASEKRFPLVLRQPGGTLGVFSSEVGRQLLEREFLAAGVKIRTLTKTPKDFIRPLGNGGFGVGFGSLLTTYRNCPNNCPLAMWWGDPDATSGALHWYPLLARKTYGNFENIKDDDDYFSF